MNEIASGIYHWKAKHPSIGVDVSSYYVEPIATVIDPMAPPEGLEWFKGRNVDRVVLTNRHHYRQAEQFADGLGVPVLVSEQAEHELKGRPGVQTYAFGDEVAPDTTAHAIEPSWPDEGALHIAIGPGVLAIADGAMHYRDQIHFIPEEHLVSGDEDPEQVKALLRAGYGRLLDLDFDVILFAHGEPITEGGKAALREFVDG